MKKSKGKSDSPKSTKTTTTKSSKSDKMTVTKTTTNKGTDKKKGTVEEIPEDGSDEERDGHVDWEEAHTLDQLWMAGGNILEELNELFG